MENLTLNDWQSFFLVFAALCALFILVMNVIRNFKELKAPGKSVEERLRRDNERLEKLEEEQSQMESDVAMILRTLLALVDHSIDGNNINGMKETKEKLQKHIIERR